MAMHRLLNLPLFNPKKHDNDIAPTPYTPSPEQVMQTPGAPPLVEEEEVPFPVVEFES